jgi:hypothetical protein
MIDHPVDQQKGYSKGTILPRAHFRQSSGTSQTKIGVVPVFILRNKRAYKQENITN